MVKKTGEKYGIIINANTNIYQPENKVDPKNFFNRTPTKILLITNMVSKREINEETYHEIRAECQNYGIVVVNISKLNSLLIKFNFRMSNFLNLIFMIYHLVN